MYIVLIAIFVGAIIGYFTNALAIKMLFRPLKPWKVGNLKIPFTPGLIPRRKEEIAASIGYLVENYLFTPNGLINFIEKTNLKEQTYLKLTEKINNYLKVDITIGKLLASTFSKDYRQEILNLSEKKIINLINDEQLKAKSLKELLSDETIIKLEANLDLLAPYLLNKLNNYLQTIEGRRLIEDLIKQALEGKKIIGFFAGFLMDSQFQEKIIEYIEQILKDDKIRSVLGNLIYNEWDKIKNEPIGTFISKHNDIIDAEAKKIVEMGLDKLEDLSVKEVYDFLESYNLFNRLYSRLVDLTISKIGNLFSYLSISNVVKEEVNRFSLEKLESIIIGIAGRELKMITYLGGIIGALIGFLQGMLYLLY